MFKIKNKFILIFIIILFSIISIKSNVYAENNVINDITNDATIKPPTIKYQSHVESIGWQNYETEGKTSGTVGKSLRMEAIKIKLDVPSNSNIKISYKAHIESIGWQNWVQSDKIAGTTGKSLRMEAIQIKLENSSNYSIMYRAHVESIGWQDWVADGKIAGTTGKSLRMEAIEIKIVPLISRGTMNIDAPSNNPTYNKNTNTIIVTGWKMANVSNTKILAYLDSSSKPIDENSINYSKRPDVINAIKNFGTEKENPNPGFSFSIDLTNLNDGVHNIKVVLFDSKLKTLATRTINFTTSRNLHIKYKAHIEKIGWQGYKQDGDLSGTTGKSLRMEGLNIELVNAPKGASVLYQAHVEKIGWQSWVKNGDLSGTTGKSLRIEAIKIKLENMPDYSIEYQVHIESLGWSNWVSNGDIAGTFGRSLRLEGIKIRLIKKQKKNAIYGIDVSQHQKTIDWEKVKKSGQVEFAILRCGYGKDLESQDDTEFLRNMKECERLKIPYGVYIYSYSLVTKDPTGNSADPYSEAKHVLRLVNGHKPQYGIWFDMENDSYKERYGMPSNETLIQICDIFCNQIKKAGYSVGIYSNLNWLNGKLNSPTITNKDIWVAHWSNKCGYTKTFKVWQFSNSGTISGIQGPVDLDLIYK